MLASHFTSTGSWYCSVYKKLVNPKTHFINWWMSLESRHQACFHSSLTLPRHTSVSFSWLQFRELNLLHFQKQTKDSVLMLAIQQFRYRRQGLVLTQGLQQNQWQFSFSVANWGQTLMRIGHANGLANWAWACSHTQSSAPGPPHSNLSGLTSFCVEHAPEFQLLLQTASLP